MLFPGEYTVNGTETSPVAQDKLLLFHSTALHAIYCRNSSCSRQNQWKSKPISLEIYFQWTFPAALFIIIITLPTTRLMIRLECVSIYLYVYATYVSITQPKTSINFHVVAYVKKKMYIQECFHSCIIGAHNSNRD